MNNSEESDSNNYNSLYEDSCNYNSSYASPSPSQNFIHNGTDYA